MNEAAPPIRSGWNDACEASVEVLFRVFAGYTNPGRDFCDFCYSPEEIKAITRTLLRELDEESGRKLLWESADHWESVDVYRHYLPRVLQLMGPPWFVDDPYWAHLFETLLALGFRDWPSDEQAAVVEYLECLGPHLRLPGEGQHLLWMTCVAVLRDPVGVLPSEVLPDLDDA